MVTSGSVLKNSVTVSTTFQETMASMNQIVVSVYKSIIEDVIDKLRPEFANVGIEENVLHELEMTWENKVMNSGVANFPADFVSGAEFVDPAPAQAEAIAQPAAEPQLQLPNGQITLAQLSKLYAQQTAGGAAAGSAGNARQSSASSSTPLIKSEFGGYVQAGAQPAQRPPVPSQMAYAQAQNILQQQTSASGTLNPQLLQYIQLAQQKQQQQRRFPQVDGPADVDAGDEGSQEDTVEEGVETSLSREAADLAFNRQAASIYAQRSRETAELRAALVAGGGNEGETSGGADDTQASTVPVRGRKKDRRRCKLHANSAVSDEGSVAATASTNTRPPTIPQVDGDVNEDEEEEDDGADGAGSDGIGSDLDSDSSGDEAEESDLCLCQYDKVQRTRNKWRCGFRDGVLSVAGKDYLFHRANGDFEW